MESTSDMRLQCVVVTPERKVFEEPVDFVALPMFDGELGVLPGRAPLIGRLGYGEMRARTGERTLRYFLDGGFAQIRDNVVTVLTSKAVAAEDINTTKLTAQLEAAPEPAATPEARAAQQAQLAKARAQLRVAGKGTAASHH